MRLQVIKAMSVVSLFQKDLAISNARWLRCAQVATPLLIALMLTTTASGYTFGDWASDNDYSPGDTMPEGMYAGFNLIDSLDGIGEYDWTTTPTTTLKLNHNQISSIEAGDFDGLTNLTWLDLQNNQISSTEQGDFSGLTNLTRLWLQGNQISSIEPGDFSGLANLTELMLSYNQISSIEAGDFSELTNLTELWLGDNQISSIASVDFSGLSNLTWLSLGSNISSIELGDFSELTNLTGLGLRSNQISSIESGNFSGLTNLTTLDLRYNQISSIASGDFSGLTNLSWLDLGYNQISSIEAGAFSELSNLRVLDLPHNTDLTELNLAEADFSNLISFDVLGNVNITSVSLNDAVVNQTSLAALIYGGNCSLCELNIGIGELDGITNMDLSGIDFSNITDLGPLYVMDDLTDLWLVDTANLDATDLDLLLDNLETIEGTDTEGILYMTQANFDAFNTIGGGLLAVWNAELGHHVAFTNPEPSTLLLSLLGLSAVGVSHRRRCKA